jgi:hypothetical protein
MYVSCGLWLCGTGTPVRGRATHLDCAGVCGKTRPTVDFCYRARREADKARSGEATSSTTIMCWGCSAADEVLDSILDSIFRVPAKWLSLVLSARQHFCPSQWPWSQRRWVFQRVLQGERGPAAAQVVAGIDAVPRDRTGSGNTRSQVRTMHLQQMMTQWLDEEGMAIRPQVVPCVVALETRDEEDMGLAGTSMYGDDY